MLAKKNRKNYEGVYARPDGSTIMPKYVFQSKLYSNSLSKTSKHQVEHSKELDRKHSIKENLKQNIHTSKFDNSKTKRRSLHKD